MSMRWWRTRKCIRLATRRLIRWWRRWPRIFLCCEVMLHTLQCRQNWIFPMFQDVTFHELLVWVPYLAAEGPYWVPISPKVGSLFQSLGVPISFGDSADRNGHC